MRRGSFLGTAFASECSLVRCSQSECSPGLHLQSGVVSTPKACFHGGTAQTVMRKGAEHISSERFMPPPAVWREEEGAAGFRKDFVGETRVDGQT